MVSSLCKSFHDCFSYRSISVVVVQIKLSPIQWLIEARYFSRHDLVSVVQDEDSAYLCSYGEQAEHFVSAALILAGLQVFIFRVRVVQIPRDMEKFSFRGVKVARASHFESHGDDSPYCRAPYIRSV